ncbi:MAG: DUF6016 domain-containing protein, partial [Parabacteroides sp.]
IYTFLIVTKCVYLYQYKTPFMGDCGTVIADGMETNVFERYRVRLCPREGKYGVQIPLGEWHSVEVYEPSTIFEAKDGAFKA